MTEGMERVLELKEKIKKLSLVVSEGEAYYDFTQSNFYTIFLKTFKAQKELYESEAHKAIKSNLSNVANYLGRMEQINDMFSYLDKFQENCDQAHEEIELVEKEIKELQEEMNKPDTSTMDVGGAMG